MRFAVISSIVALGAGLLAAATPSTPGPAAPPDGGDRQATWIREDEQWRERRMERLRSPDGWLTLVGLYWVDDQPQRFGSAPDNDIVLPEGAPAHAGTFRADLRGVTVEPAPGAVLLGDQPLQGTRLLRGDEHAEPDVLRVGRLKLTAIRRSKRWAIRAKDPESPLAREFKGIESWPIDPKWRIEAEWVPHATERQLMIPTAQGVPETVRSPGVARFRVHDTDVTLEPILEEPEATEMLFVFKDATSGKTTYGGGRFLYADLPKDGKVVLDFNRAYNPPCAFTPYATCPLPPRGNRLKLPIEAGEKSYGKHAPPGLTRSSSAGN